MKALESIEASLKELNSYNFDILKSERNSILNNLEFGSLAEWVGIVVTVLTIYLTIRHYAKDNQKNFRFMIYQKNKQEKESDGKVTIFSDTNIHIHVYNNSKMPIHVRIEGLRNKRGWLKKIYGDIIGKQGLVPLDSREALLIDQINYFKVEPYDLSEPLVIDTGYLKQRIESSGLDPTLKIEILFREIAGSYSCATLHTSSALEHKLETIVNSVIKLFDKANSLINALKSKL